MSDGEAVNVSMTKNTASLTLGIIAIVLAVLALLVSWKPFLGLLAIPAAVIAVLLALIGLLLAVVKRSGFVMPFIGLVLSFLPIAISIVSTGATSAAIAEAIEASEARERAAIDLIEVSDLKLGIERFGDPSITVGYTLTNRSSETLYAVETRVYFRDKSGTVIYEDSNYPVGITDPNMAPGQRTVVAPNPFMYTNVPADKVDSVEIKVVSVTLAD